MSSLIQSIESGEVEEESRETEVVELEDVRRLGIATIGSLKQYPRISAFRRFVEGWYLRYFAPDAARSLPLARLKRISIFMGITSAISCSSCSGNTPSVFRPS